MQMAGGNGNRAKTRLNHSHGLPARWERRPSHFCHLRPTSNRNRESASAFPVIP
jgi:hypothetical protein